jgi:hypothetical protein
MPVIDIRKGETVEIEKKNGKKQVIEDKHTDEQENAPEWWVQLLLNKFNLILIAVIIILVYFLYRAYKNE